MKFPQCILHVAVSVFLLGRISSLDPGWLRSSLWGKVADFTNGCSHWRLRPQVSVGALQELTVCVHLQLQTSSDSIWTAFMYRAPRPLQTAELGLGGGGGRVYVWLFGRVWSAPWLLSLGEWHQVCLAWLDSARQPCLYVNGTSVEVTPLPEDTPLPRYSLTPQGTLTLGVSHHVTANGELKVEKNTRLKGRVSLFRLWDRVHSQEEVRKSLICTEGEVIRWEADDWDTQMCSPVSDPGLRCAWSMYEVSLRIVIIRYDGNSTNIYTARDMAHHWLRLVLPSHVYVHRVTVSLHTRQHPYTESPNHTPTPNPNPTTTPTPNPNPNPTPTPNPNPDEKHSTRLQDRLWWADPNASRFECLGYLNVIPAEDVAEFRRKVYYYLQIPFNSRLLTLLADSYSILVTPVESFPSISSSPPIIVTADDRPRSTTSLNTPTTSLVTTSITVLPTSPSFISSSTGSLSDIFFEVNVKVTLTGASGDPAKVLLTWLNTTLPSNEMFLLNFQLLTKASRLQSASSQMSMSRLSRQSCMFQVQVITSSDDQATERQIRLLLEEPYTSCPVTIETQPEDIHIVHLRPGVCLGHSQQTRKGLFEWPDTLAPHSASLPCQGNPSLNASRLCQLGVDTHWAQPDLHWCPLVVKTIPDLDHILVTAENAMDVLVMIENLLKNHSNINFSELGTILDKLRDIIRVSKVTPPLAEAIINIISNILESDSDLQPFTNMILNITEAVGDKMSCFNDSYKLEAPAMALSVVKVEAGQFQRLTFGVSSFQQGLNPQVYINKYPLNGTVAFISLPSALRDSFPQQDHALPRVQFQFYSTAILFRSSQQGKILNTFVVSASVTNASQPIRDLEECIEVTLQHLIPNPLGKEVQCVYWDFNKHGGNGGWDGRGCKTQKTTALSTTCLCDHLTHFGVLLDVSRTRVDEDNEEILTIITYLGCGLSSLFLGVTVLTYTAFEKLRRDYPSKILINLSLALLGLNLVFLVNSWLAARGSYGLCVAVASTQHYFLLASFTWMGLEAIHMYLALVKVFNVYVPSYILKFCALGWGVPLLICGLVLVVRQGAYGSHLYGPAETMQPMDSSDAFCWLKDDVAFYVSVVGYSVLVLLLNTVVFLVVLVQIHHLRSNCPAGIRSSLLHDLKGVASLTLLLGFTWATAFFTWGPARVPFLYLFALLNSLQGFFIFLFHCLMKENVRRQWRIHLCLGRFRLEEYSEWSQTATVPARSRPNQPVPSVRSVQSSSTESTSASSSSGQRHSFTKRPNLDLLVNALALPRVNHNLASPSPHKTHSFPEDLSFHDPTWLDAPQSTLPNRHPMTPRP